jgi:hypothetical protein
MRFRSSKRESGTSTHGSNTHTSHELTRTTDCVHADTHLEVVELDATNAEAALHPRARVSAKSRLSGKSRPEVFASAPAT